MEKTEKVESKAWKISKTILNVIFYIFIAFLILFSISNFGVKDNLDIPGLFGRGFLTVESDSMAGNEEDSFTKDDLIFVKLAPESNRKEFIDSIEIYDIITFDYVTASSGIVLNTHRVVDIIVNSNGTKTFITQGDYVAMDEDKKYDSSQDSNPYCEVVPEITVKGVVTSKVSNLGKTMKYVRSETGFLICVVLPTALFLVFEVTLLIININKMKQSKLMEKTKEQREKELEEAKEKIRAELLAEMEAKSQEENENNKEEANE